MTTEPFSGEFNEADYSIERKESLYQGFFALNRYHFRHRKYNGQWTESIQREVFERGHSACVLLFDPGKQQLVLIEQFRIPAVETCQSPWQLELVAGVIEDGLTPEQIAHKEALEESNMQIKQLIPICDYLASSGGTTERVWLYIGLVDAEQAGGVYGLDSENEDIKVVVITLERLSQLIADNKIDNAALLIAGQWLLLNKEQITAHT